MTESTERPVNRGSVERRRVQRDWLGHSLFAAAVVVAVPIASWVMGVQTNGAVYQNKLEQLAKDNDQNKADIRQLTGQITTELTKLNDDISKLHLEFLRAQIPEKRK